MKPNLNGILPKKRLGQNFLINKPILDKVIVAANIKETDVVVEVGPGTGILTKAIAKKAKKVIAIEKDVRLIDILNENLSNFDNVEIVKGDILKVGNIYGGSYKVVANLPFYLTGIVIRMFLEDSNPPSDMTLIIQKEVAQRICAKVPNMNLLATTTQFYADPKIISYISKESFWPKPKVDSAIIKLVTLEDRNTDKSLFFKIVKAGFSQPRKQLVNNLAKGLKFDKDKVKDWLLSNNIQPEQRAETLTLEDWLKLTKTFIIN